MQFFIISPITCAVCVNGELRGKAANNLHRLFIPQNAAVNFTPIGDNQPIEAFFDGDGTLAPPNLKRLELFGEPLLFPIFTPRAISCCKTLFSQSLENDVHLQIDADGTVKLTVVSPTGFLHEQAPFFAPKKISVKQLESTLLLFTEEEKRKLTLIDVSGKPRVISTLEYTSFFINDGEITLTLSVPSPQGLVKELTLDLRTCAQKQVTFTRSRPISALNPLLVPLAFLKEVLFDAPFCDFLSPSLKQHEGLIKQFLGDFFTFTPLNIGQTAAVLISQKQATPVSFQLENGLICDLTYVDSWPF